jgi:hypothetical protein
VISQVKEVRVVRKTKYPHRLVEVHWVDAETDQGWQDNREADMALPVVTTVGFLVGETEQAILIASTIAGTHSNSRIKIPRGMVQDIIYL